jgi:hypothetical protein
MSKKMLLAMCLGAGVLWLPTAASGVVWNTATSPPDTAASVNGTPNGVWSTSALAKASSSQVGVPRRKLERLHFVDRQQRRQRLPNQLVLRY